MREQPKEICNLRGDAQGGSASSGTYAPTTETIEETSLAEANGEINHIVGVLSNIEVFLHFRAEDARAQAGRVTAAQAQLVRTVGSVRDLANAAAGVAEKIQAGSLAAASDLKPAAEGVIRMATIVRQLNGLSSATAATIESQTATTRELVMILGEAAQVSACLASKVAILAEEAVLPALSSKNRVEAELERLTGELQKIAVEFQRGSEAVSGNPQ
jgi:hypothetical protein